MATSFNGGRSQSTQREPPTMDKLLVNFSHCGCESSAPFFVIYKTKSKHKDWLAQNQDNVSEWSDMSAYVICCCFNEETLNKSHYRMLV